MTDIERVLLRSVKHCLEYVVVTAGEKVAFINPPEEGILQDLNDVNRLLGKEDGYTLEFIKR